MEALDLKQITFESMAIAKQIVGKAWKNLEPYAEHEFQQFAENAEFLARLRLEGRLTDEEFKARMDIQRLALKNVLLTIEGIGIITAQQVVNAVLGIVSHGIQKVMQIVLPI